MDDLHNFPYNTGLVIKARSGRGSIVRSPEWHPGYLLELSDCRRFVAYRPLEVGILPDDFARRRTAIGEFAALNGVSSIVLDYRGVDIPVREGFVDAAIKAPGFRNGSKWRIAVLVSLEDKSHSKAGARLLAELLTAMKQDARKFFDYDLAVEWLVDQEAPGLNGIPAPISGAAHPSSLPR